MKFNLNDYNNKNDRQKFIHHTKQASSWSGNFEHEFDGLTIQDPPCTCEGTAEINYNAYYYMGTWEDPPESDAEINVLITKIRCEKDNGEEQLVDEKLLEKVKGYLEEDEGLQEKVFDERY